MSLNSVNPHLVTRQAPTGSTAPARGADRNQVGPTRPASITESAASCPDWPDCCHRGPNKAEVAARLGISRRTVYYWVNSGQLDRELDDEPVRYKPRPVVARKVDAFRGIVQMRLSEYPKLSAVRLFDHRLKGHGVHHGRDRTPTRSQTSGCL